MLNASKLRKGMTILFNNEPCIVVAAQHQKTARGGANIQSKLKNIKDGTNQEYRWRSDEKFEEVRLDEVPMEYLYQDGDNYCFMNNETYEQIMIHQDQIEDKIKYIVPNTDVVVAFYETTPIDIILPKTVTLEVSETGPNVKGNSAGNITKPATMETGLVVQVPVFIETGEKLNISTADGSYESRSK